MDLLMEKARRGSTDPADVREADIVDKVLLDEVDGAWAIGKAPIELITTFLRLLEDEETEDALNVVQQILSHEPDNTLIKKLHTALQLKLVVEAAEAQGHESSESSEDDTDEEEDDESDIEEDEALEAEAKDVEL
ncbi:hypothetical protein THRCLA_22384 [Thraustotheca clavata]|uniref:Uncharacterized protein n=1 Tax=Thraustotheca clavata TaxID=74557 RepID=A0A1V9Z394_9STRA|nr:hypothetical protein THRCLA_22384 [Thraustotheca clavata]